MSRDPLRVVFMGTPAFAIPALRTLVERGHVVVGVYTQPDRRAGRGRKLRASPVKVFSEECGLPVFQPRSLRQDTESARSDLARSRSLMPSSSPRTACFCLMKCCDFPGSDA